MSFSAALLSIQSALGVLIVSVPDWRGQLLDDQVVFDFLRQEESGSQIQMEDHIQTIIIDHVCIMTKFQ